MEAPHKHPTMIVHQEEPLNAGPPLPAVRHTYTTPQEYFFVRNHGNIPVIDSTQYCLSITGMVKHELELSLAELQMMPTHTVSAILQCAGSRRDELAVAKPIPGELLWGAEAIGNAVWRGVLLQTVLEVAGVMEDAHHVAFTGLDEVQRHGEKFGFGGSVPLEKVRDVLLAYEMNGNPLASVHGFPLRAVVPGYIRARSVKWLSNINLQEYPSTNYFQAHTYKLFPPHIDSQNVDWNNGEMLGELLLNTVICQPVEGTTCPAGPVAFQGYAVTQSGIPIERVELSVDGGTTWIAVARLFQPHPLVLVFLGDDTRPGAWLIPLCGTCVGCECTYPARRYYAGMELQRLHE